MENNCKGERSRRPRQKLFCTVFDAGRKANIAGLKNKDWQMNKKQIKLSTRCLWNSQQARGEWGHSRGSGGLLGCASGAENKSKIINNGVYSMKKMRGEMWTNLADKILGAFRHKRREIEVDLKRGNEQSRWEDMRKESKRRKQKM